MLVAAMGIGRQSLYDTFGDKWQLYQAALRHYAMQETSEHIAMLRSQPSAIGGIKAMVTRVVEGAHDPCLGVHAICEFGRSRPELTAISATAESALRQAMVGVIAQARADGDIAADLDPQTLATFLIASFAGIRIAARGGATPLDLRVLGDLTLRALR